MIPKLNALTGLLPLGRHPCTQAEVEQSFVTAATFSSSTTRAAIWHDWQRASLLLQQAVKVHAAWIGGSFTTKKVDPGDIDVTFLINGDDYRKRTPADKQVVALFAHSQVKSALGLNVDTYTVSWHCVPDPALANGLHRTYFLDRGHWDDWWQRQRVTPKGEPPIAEDTPPRRGYLEVPFNDYL